MAMVATPTKCDKCGKPLREWGFWRVYIGPVKLAACTKRCARQIDDSEPVAVDVYRALKPGRGSKRK